MNDFVYVQAVIVNRNEPWFFRWDEQQNDWVPHHRIKQVIDGEVIIKKSELIVEEVIS